jgi:hypothetical protein
MRYFFCVAALLLPEVKCSLPIQTTITTGSLNPDIYFDYILRIGATVSRSADDNFARPGAQLWGAFELFSEVSYLQHCYNCLKVPKVVTCSHVVSTSNSLLLIHTSLN